MERARPFLKSKLHYDYDHDDVTLWSGLVTPTHFQTRSARRRLHTDCGRADLVADDVTAARYAVLAKQTATMSELEPPSLHDVIEPSREVGFGPGGGNIW